MHLQEEERKIYITLSNQERQAQQEQARADKVWNRHAKQVPQSLRVQAVAPVGLLEKA